MEGQEDCTIGGAFFNVIFKVTITKWDWIAEMSGILRDFFPPILILHSKMEYNINTFGAILDSEDWASRLLSACYQYSAVLPSYSM